MSGQQPPPNSGNRSHAASMASPRVLMLTFVRFLKHDRLLPLGSKCGRIRLIASPVPLSGVGPEPVGEVLCYQWFIDAKRAWCGGRGEPWCGRPMTKIVDRRRQAVTSADTGDEFMVRAGFLMEEDVREGYGG